MKQLGMQKGGAASGAPWHHHSPGGHVVDVPDLELPFPLWVDTEAHDPAALH